MVYAISFSHGAINKEFLVFCLGLSGDIEEDEVRWDKIDLGLGKKIKF